MSDNLYEIKMKKYQRKLDASTVYIEITDTTTNYKIFVTIDEILDSLSDKELKNLLVRIAERKAYKETVVTE